MSDGQPALRAGCGLAAVTSAVCVAALLLFYGVELRTAGPHVFGPLNDIGTVGWDLLVVVVVAGLRPLLRHGRATRALVAATVALSLAGAVASALLVVEVLPFEVSTPVSVLAILVQSLWLHELSRALRGGAWSVRVVRLGLWAPRAQGAGAVLVGLGAALGLLLPWGSPAQVVVIGAGVALGLPAWAAWPLWFAWAGRELRADRPARAVRRVGGAPGDLRVSHH